MRGLVVAVLLTACGRVSFDARTDAADTLADISADAVDPNLFARYSFDDDPADGPRDDTGHGHDGSCTFSCPTLVPGRIGSAYRFNGTSDGLNLPDLRPASLTVSAWVYRQSPVLSQAIISRPFGASAQNTFQLVIGGSYHLVMLAAESVAVGTLADSGTVVEVERWYHVAFVSDQTTVRGYIDGVEFGAQPLAMAYDNHNVYVGVDVDSGSYTGYLAGLVDELRMYDRALSAPEIQRLATGLDP